MDLFAGEVGPPLYVSAMVSNQGRFYPRFDEIVLLSAPAEVLLKGIEARTRNPGIMRMRQTDDPEEDEGARAARMARIGAEQTAQRWYWNKITLMAVAFPIYAVEEWPARINGSGSQGDDLTHLVIGHVEALPGAMFVQRPRIEVTAAAVATRHERCGGSGTERRRGCRRRGILLGSSAPPAFAGWSASPTAPLRGQLAAAQQHCSTDSGTPVLTDTRGPYTASIDADGSTCVDGNGIEISAGRGGGTTSRIPAGTVQLNGAGESDSDGHALTMVDGPVGSGVTGVTITPSGGSSVHATVNNGWYLAWWPGTERAVAAQVQARAAPAHSPSRLDHSGSPRPARRAPIAPAATALRLGGRISLDARRYGKPTFSLEYRRRQKRGDIPPRVGSMKQA